MTLTLDLSIFDFDLNEMLSRAQSHCFDRAQPSAKPQHQNPAEDPDDRGIDPGLMTVIVDTLRDYHDACGAVVLAIRKWREAKPERSLPRGHPRRPK